MITSPAGADPPPGARLNHPYITGAFPHASRRPAALAQPPARYNTSENVSAGTPPVAPSTNKKVIIRRFDREPLAGYVNPQTYLERGGVELLSLGGAVLLVPFDEVKAVDFVRDFESDAPPPEPRVFQARPKISGLWVRMRFRDGELMDGLLPHNLLQWEPQGFTVVPPNPSSRRQRVFVPRSALAEILVLGVVGSPLRPHKAPRRRKEEQIGLFE